MHEHLLTQLKRHEGIRHKPYKDTVGKLSIGVGRNLDDRGLRDDEIELMLMNDIEEATEEAHKVPGYYRLNEPRKCVIINMIFNMGLPRVLRFKKMIAALALELWHEAAEQMLDSKWADQVGNRAIELAEQMRTGKWQE
jgi:lysozyme